MDNNVIIIIILSSIFFLSGFFFLYKIKLSREYGIGRVEPKVSIIIPARNEEHNIGRLLESINSQDYKNYEILVVDDDSTDKTGEISKGLGARIIIPGKLPQDWLGKPWACYQGANNATGELFIFLDADTFLEPNGLTKIVSTYIHESENHHNSKDVVLSILPFHKVKRLYEDFSSVFNLLMIGAMNAFTPLKYLKPTGLYGQSLILGKEEYWSIGGHESVKGKILENVYMAELFTEKGYKLVCCGGRGSLSFRMYPDGMKNLIDGWTKAFASGASKTSLISMISIIMWISGGFTISISLIFTLFISDYILLSSIGYILFSIQMYWMLHRIGTYKIISALIFPLHLLFFVIIFSRSIYYQVTKKKIQWKSRNVSSE